MAILSTGYFFQGGAYIIIGTYLVVLADPVFGDTAAASTWLIAAPLFGFTFIGVVMMIGVGTQTGVTNDSEIALVITMALTLAGALTSNVGR